MKANFQNIRLEIFGGSHSDRIGGSLAGVPIGTRLDMHCVKDLLCLRRPKDFFSTPRREDDIPSFEGVREERGEYIVENAQIGFYIANNNIRSADYDNIRHIPRPSHADLAAWAKDGEIPVGGGRFSGRMTAPLCVAGGIVKELLERRGIFVDAYATRIAGIDLKGAYDVDDVATKGLCDAQREQIRARELPALDSRNIPAALERLGQISAQGDSAGGVVECVVSGLEAGEAGDALFDGIEGKLAYAVYAVPAVKSVEFGKGVSLADMLGSEANDPIGLNLGKPVPLKNASGGINGGVCNGLPVILRAAVRPTPSISLPQRSVDLDDMSECELKISGRHDVCIVPRAVPAIEAAVALAVYDMLAALA